MKPTTTHKTKTPTGVWQVKIDLSSEKKAATTISPDRYVQEKNGVLVITIDEQTNNPIIISHKEDSGSFQEIEVIVRAGINATIIEDVPTNHTSKLSLYVCENSTLHYARTQKNGVYKGVTNAKVCGTLHYCEMNLGSTHNTIHAQLEENSYFTNTNILLGNKKDELHITPTVSHKKNSTSLLSAKAILNSATAIYDGIVHIPQDAHKSVAHQRIDAVLLDKDSEMKESPQLFIDNKDVVCSHAATSTKPSYEQLFYLQTRGVPLQQAQALTIQAQAHKTLQNTSQEIKTLLAPILDEMIQRFTNKQEQE